MSKDAVVATEEYRLVVTDGDFLSFGWLNTKDKPGDLDTDLAAIRSHIGDRPVENLVIQWSPFRLNVSVTYKT